MKLGQEQAHKEIERLSQKIEKYNYRYYVLSQPAISDKAYDDLLKKLIKLEEQFPEFKDINSPSQRVGTKISAAANTIHHKVKMYSLDNTYSIEELHDWQKRVEKGLGSHTIEYVTELKIDGVSAALTYENGILFRATREMD